MVRLVPVMMYTRSGDPVWFDIIAYLIRATSSTSPGGIRFLPRQTISLFSLLVPTTNATRRATLTEEKRGERITNTKPSDTIEN